MCVCVGAQGAVHTFRAVKAQLASPTKHALPDLAGVDVRNASRSLTCHNPPLHLKHWQPLPSAELFQVLLCSVSALLVALCIRVYLLQAGNELACTVGHSG